MSTKKTYAIFGLGRYGIAVARELVNNGMEVIAVDADEKIVNAAANELPICKCADITDPDVIRQLGIANADVVIIAMANNLEASVMAVTLCKELGIKTIIAKSANEMHQKILTRVGADKVVFPENESGIRLAKNLLSSGLVDMVSLAKNVSMIELDVKPEWLGKNLIELNLRKKYSVNVVALRKGESVSVDIDPHAPLQADDKLIVIANTEKISKLK
ncbi:MAG: TrkA family potassium uptake protein [Oscillospiraceae bacterium]|nr:TrkA family potassium uptake protein [Oscillospiraceae bacterium]